MRGTHKVIALAGSAAFALTPPRFDIPISATTIAERVNTSREAISTRRDRMIPKPIYV